MRRLLQLITPLLCMIPMLGAAVTITEDFSTNPTNRHWKMFGDTNLFRWNTTNQNLEVTWDSSKTNSYFHYFFGTIITREDDFSLSFDLRLQDALSNTTPGKTNAMPLAIGFLNYTNATNVNFSRATGVNATYGVKNLVEFDYFPAFSSFSPTIAQVVVSTNNVWLYNHNLQAMTAGDLFHIAMSYSAATLKLTTITTRNGAPYATQNIAVTGSMDFRADMLSISSYSDQHSTDSILAHGTIDNLVLTTPTPPTQNLRGYFTNAQWCVEFNSLTNWNYALEHSTNFLTWTQASVRTNGTGGKLTLSATNSLTTTPDFYRVRANRP